MMKNRALIQRIFPFTARGLLFLLVSAALFVIGVVRADLAALFWGCGFLLLSLYGFFGSHIFSLLIRRALVTGNASAEIRLPSSGVFAGEEAAAVVSTSIPAFFLPGFHLILSVDLQWKPRRQLAAQAVLSPGRGSYSLPLQTRKRGRYSCRRLDIKVCDLLGFTSSLIRWPCEDYLVVMPQVLRREVLLLQVSGEETTDTTRRRRTSDELLEVRKYYPGDDMRRLNWKVLAHTGELFLRKGEETPPPDSRLVFIFDPSATDAVTPSFAADYLDSYVETVASILVLSLEGGTPVTLSIPGRKGFASLTGE